MITRTGYIGIGTMGRPIATNVLQAGFDLMVYDVRQEPLDEMSRLGARIAESPMEVAQHAELIEISVVDDDQVRSVVEGPEGILAGAKPGLVIAVHSTIHPDTARYVGEQAAPRGVQVLDAAVSGGSAGAQARTLCYMVGGDKETFERCRPVFETSGSNIFYMGPLGMGAATKVAQQLMTCIHMLAASEGFAVASRAGVDLDAFEQLLRVSSGQSRMAEDWHRRTWDPHVTELFYVGLRPAIELGHDLGLPLPGTALTQQLIRQFLTRTV